MAGAREQYHGLLAWEEEVTVSTVINIQWLLHVHMSGSVYVASSCGCV